MLQYNAELLINELGASMQWRSGGLSSQHEPVTAAMLRLPCKMWCNTVLAVCWQNNPVANMYSALRCLFYQPPPEVCNLTSPSDNNRRTNPDLHHQVVSICLEVVPGCAVRPGWDHTLTATHSFAASQLILVSMCHDYLEPRDNAEGMQDIVKHRTSPHGSSPVCIQTNYVWQSRNLTDYSTDGT